ncbi:hypothetical protein Corgl_0798 [Coriobacterium glomerans PW2]|uniref:Uncharacterized protein n=1 Tax=Coriobacterium glomerans (strain ATCC 49209 / DSM 20642 / JCM 10262 / PW2) TaxID=700015 RepID=F2N7L9_CORGP|nr:hypothetical protein Corgl_0798 [Coriobacterium glomerans PW2]
MRISPLVHKQMLSSPLFNRHHLSNRKMLPVALGHMGTMVICISTPIFIIQVKTMEARASWMDRMRQVLSVMADRHPKPLNGALLIYLGR